MGKLLPKLTFDLDRDLKTLAAMASGLTPYLYESEMYGYLDGDLPKLTLGGLLMRLHRLGHLAPSLNTEQQTLISKAHATFETERSHWAVHYDQKLQHELQSRVDSFDQFLNEWAEDPSGSSANYPTQAEKRVMIKHLQQEATERGVLSDMYRTRITEIDQKLHHALTECDFIFDERLRDIYPHTEFWWLYACIVEAKS
jgi:hypothetical protein